MTMTLEEARDVMNDSEHYVALESREKGVTYALDGKFSTRELEAMLVIARHKEQELAKGQLTADRLNTMLKNGGWPLGCPFSLTYIPRRNFFGLGPEEWTRLVMRSVGEQARRMIELHRGVPDKLAFFVEVGS